MRNVFWEAVASAPARTEADCAIKAALAVLFTPTGRPADRKHLVMINANCSSLKMPVSDHFDVLCGSVTCSSARRAKRSSIWSSNREDLNVAQSWNNAGSHSSGFDKGRKCTRRACTEMTEFKSCPSRFGSIASSIADASEAGKKR